MGKTDPGPTLPWKDLALDGVGIWPSQTCPDSVRGNLSAARAQELLTRAGYNVPLIGIFDLETNLSIGAARLHWNPACYDASTDLANDCYSKPFDSDLACSLNNLAEKNDISPYQTSSLMFVLCATGPLLLIFFICLVYKIYKDRQQREYEEIPDNSLRLT